MCEHFKANYDRDRDEEYYMMNICYALIHSARNFQVESLEYFGLRLSCFNKKTDYGTSDYFICVLNFAFTIKSGKNKWHRQHVYVHTRPPCQLLPASAHQHRNYPKTYLLKYNYTYAILWTWHYIACWSNLRQPDMNIWLTSKGTWVRWKAMEIFVATSTVCLENILVT